MGHICKVAIFSFVLILQWSAIKAQQDYEISVSEKDVIDGYIPVKVRLQNYELPAVKLENIKFRPLNQDQDSSQIKSLDQLKVHIGKERKIPFAVIHIPVFLQDSSGKSVKFVTGFTLKVQEKDDTSATSSSSVPKRNSWKTTSINSPLATGTWYKVSVPASGLYKVDYDFIVSQLGVNNIASDQIRVFGHGGKMLSERNSSEIIEGLIENAIYIEDGGDGALGPGDFFMFYAQGPVNWYADDSNKNLIPKKNIYSDEGYYFLNFDGGTTGKRLDKQSSIPAGNITVNSYTGVALHEYDLVNPQRYGKKWWGEEFSNAPGKQTDQNFSLNVGNTIGNTKFSLNVVNTANSPGKFNISLNGQSIQSIEIGAANNYEYAPRALGKEVKFSAGVSGRADIEINYQNNSNDGSGWLDYISLNSVKPLDMESNSVTFTDLNSLRPGNKATYQISNASSGIQVWDISIPNNPLQMSGSWNNGIYSFTSDASTLHHFVAVNAPKSLPVPGFVSIIPNQNLFGSPQVDYIIVTHPEFKTAAERLGNFHRERDGMRVIIATTTQVYNEFSSGAQDIGAIRDFARMFYQRAGMNVENMPKYLLLLGDASYDYKDRISSNTNFVPTFESDESYDLINSFSNDDYFGFLDDNENIEDYSIINTVDIGIGRIPAKTSIEANEVVDKIIHYKNPGTLTPARINTMYIADNEDAAGDFINSTEIMKSAVDSEVDYLNSIKIYEDAIPFVSTPGGQRAPEANKAINDGIRKGMFMVNYIGHGNPSVLAHERILTIDDYNKWRNLDKLPFMVTATCDFGQFDQPSFVSSGERLLLKPDGGTIAMLTTTQLVYNYANEILNKEYLTAQFNRINDRWNTFGDAVRIGKNGTYGKASVGESIIINFRKFVLLGDPALTPNFPRYYVKSSTIRDGFTGDQTNTIKALGEYVIEGYVTDGSGNKLEDFNGVIYTTIFDKPRKVKTITSVNKIFEVRSNIIYRGKATVTNGVFTINFIAPKDINYEYGQGKISYYAENGQTDGAGVDTAVAIGGYSDNPRVEYDSPIVKAYIKDSLFRNGGLTGSNTALFAIIEDETGINISGNSIGHDLTAVLDGDVSNPYIMNDYYETAPNTYKKGFLYFPVENIPEGRHRFTIKAWDVNNNSGEGYVDFVVKDGQIVAIQELGNYPNPFRDKTNFVFEHNRPDENLKAEVNIYNTTGLLVRKLNKDFISTGSRSNEISWDGTDNNGTKLTPGLYIYKMNLMTETGIESAANQKLIILP